MEVIKGSTFKIIQVVYSYWSGQADTSTLANITGSTIKLFLKQRDSDPDSAALLTLNGTVTDGPNGECEVAFTAANTNDLSYSSLVYEVVVKLADSSYLRSGVLPFILKPNVGKVLF